MATNELKKSRQLSSSDISAFCSQISMMIHAGIPVSEGIGIMCEDSSDSKGKALLEGMHKQVELGEPLFAAMHQSGAFPKYAVDMVEIGEKTGRLDDVAASLGSYYERDDFVAKTVKNAVAYPAVMIIMMTVVIIVLITRVLPIFSQVFERLGATLSPLAQGLLNFGSLLSRYSAIILGVIGVLAIAFLVLKNTAFGAKMLQGIYRRGFASRQFVAVVSSSRFANAMALMLHSGLDVQESLDMTAKLVDDESMQKKISRCKELIEGGTSFSDAVAQAQIFSGMNARMLTVGFKAGAVESVMDDIARRYEDEIDTRISKIISILEPTLVAILCIVVGMILLSVMLPLMGIMSSIG